MGMANEKRSIPAFHMQGVVLKEDAGNVLEAFFLADEQFKTGVMITPMVVGASPAPLVINGSAQPNLPALPPPKKKSRVARNSPTRELKAFLRQLITEKAPIHRLEIFKTAAHNGYSKDGIRARLYELFREKEVKRKKNFYSPNARMAKKMNGKAKPKATLRRGPAGKESITSIALRMTQDAHPNAIASRAIAAVIKKKGLRPESVSVALNNLKARGLVEGVPVTDDKFSKFHYKFIQQPQQ
jgi:hypothetical protein